MSKTVIITFTVILTIAMLVLAACKPFPTSTVTSRTTAKTTSAPMTTRPATTTAAPSSSRPASTSSPVSTKLATTTSAPSTSTSYGYKNWAAVSNLTPSSPNTLYINNRVKVTINYTIENKTGAKIWAIPYTQGKRSPNSTYEASDIIIAGNGTINRFFTISSGKVNVDQINLIMNNSDQSMTLLNTFVPVNFSFVP